MSLLALSLTLAGTSTAVLILYYLSIRLGQYYRLRHIPGPLTASLTNLWLLQKLRSGNYRDAAICLDQKYGPVVKYGPKRVLFSHVDAVPIIHGTTNPMIKGDNYTIPVPMINGKLTPSFASIRDEKRVSAIRRQIGSAFSTTAILDYELHIDETIQVLISNLRDSSSPVNLQQWLSFFAFDTMCRLAFSDDPGMMNRQQDVGETMKGGRDRFMYWNHWFAIPKIESLLYKNRFFRGVVPQNILTSMAIKRVQDRMQKGGAGTHEDLLDRYFQAREKAPDVFDIGTISSITLSTIHAGSETTAHTLSHVFWHLFQNPAVYDQLKKECREADLSSPPKFSEVNASKMPFIEACIKEAQRVGHLIINPLEHIVPEGGATICGTFVPGGTTVAVNHHALSLSPTIYGPSPHTYNPSRWLTCSPSQRATMDRASLSFSAGKRGCIGVHLAWAEMLKVLAALIREFEIELADETFEVKVGKKMVGFIGELPIVVRERVVER